MVAEVNGADGSKAAVVEGAESTAKKLYVGVKKGPDEAPDYSEALEWDTTGLEQKEIDANKAKLKEFDERIAASFDNPNTVLHQLTKNIYIVGKKCGQYRPDQTPAQHGEWQRALTLENKLKTESSLIMRQNNAHGQEEAGNTFEIMQSSLDEQISRWTQLVMDGQTHTSEFGGFPVYLEDLIEAASDLQQKLVRAQESADYRKKTEPTVTSA